MEEEYEAENEENLLPEGTFAIKLSQETQERYEVVADWDISELEPQKEIPLDALKLEISEYKEESDFFFLADYIKTCKLLAPLLIFDPTEQYGEKYLLCLSGEAKYGYLQNDEDSNMVLVDADTPYRYDPPVPKKWKSLKSDQLIERDWVTDSRPKIMLQIKRSVPRSEGAKAAFSDRNVDDVGDGYVACESYKDSHVWEHVAEMERAMQAVPILVEGGSQTELKHPKNVYTQYEPRVFSEEEVSAIWESPQMKKFLTKAEEIMQEVALEPDIMGSLREEIESFYRRDHVEVVEETELIENTFFTDLNFSHNSRVTHVRWHPKWDGIVAMSVMENTVYEEYLNNLTKRMVMPTMMMIWSMDHPLFPQLLMRVPDDVNVFEWHPIEPDILIGGCLNGQAVIYDLGEYSRKLSRKICIWDHSVVMSNQTNKLHLEDGFIPILYWSAESNMEFSHSTPVESLKWLPKSVWFSHESAYPKVNQNEQNRQFLTCAADMFILVWDLLKPPADTGITEHIEPEHQDQEEPKESAKSSKLAWSKLRAKSSVAMPIGTMKWSPAVGKYSFLNKIWRPVHRIQFLDPTPPPALPGGGHRPSEETIFLKVLITALSVTDRPDLMKFERKGSVMSQSQSTTTAAKTLVQSASLDEDGSEGRGSRGSIDGTKNEEDDDIPPPDPSNMALPTMLMAGTILGSVFRADLSRNKVDVETNNLLCTIEWMTAIHDGPVEIMTKSPFLPHLLLSMGGYSFAVWNEGIMNKPVILHFVDREQLTCVAWSIEQPNIVFFSGEKGDLEVWDITKRRSEPIQTQNIAGRAINGNCFKT